MLRGSMLFILLTAVCRLAGAYDPGPEMARTVAMNTVMVNDMLGPYLSLRRSQPIMSSKERLEYALDFSYGSAAAPLHAYKYKNQLDGLFDPETVYRQKGERLPVINFALNLSLPLRMLVILDLGGFPAIRFRNHRKWNFKTSVNVYYRFLFEKFLGIGMLAGGGYGFTKGEIGRQLFLSDTELSTDTFRGWLATDWQRQFIDLELFIHKTFFVINFYFRTSYYFLFGSTASAVTGRFERQNWLAERSSAEAVHSLVSSAGFEVILGRIKVCFEAGRDWLNSGLCGSLGLKYGM